MSGSILGNFFKISTWGESHGKAIGVVIDGCPSGLKLNEEDIQIYLNRRRPGQSQFSTPREEDDKVEIMSGTFEGVTTGTPISLMVPNKTQQSKDYSDIANYYRPGHADYTFDGKYGFRDYRGGGRSSGRETIGRVAAGAIALKILKELGIEIYAYTKSIGNFEVNMQNFDKEEIMKNSLYMPDKDIFMETSKYIEQVKAQKDSVGGVVECVAKGVPIGLGDPVFDKLDALLSKAIMSIGAVKAIEIGNGMQAASLCGSANNDPFISGEDGICKTTNHSGGILGGISDGDDIILRAYIKPTPSISREQTTVNKQGEDITIEIKGRHDPIIVPRAVVVVESMVGLTLVDSLFSNMNARMENIKEFYHCKK